jgi:hypothetical protein
VTARAAFKQDDLTRACKGLRNANVPIARVIIEEGRITIVTGGGESAKAGDPNPWNEDLDAEEEG